MRFSSFLISALCLAGAVTDAWSDPNPPVVVAPESQRITFDVPTLAPMAHVRFCLRYEQQCQKQRRIFRGSRLKLTESRQSELAGINRQVNIAIRPRRDPTSLNEEAWILHPVAGDCNDYAVTKRSALIAKGWPARALLLSEVVTRWGEHHLVLVVRTRQGDLVLDNLTASIEPWSKTTYQWVRIQTPRDPWAWSAMRWRNVVASSS